MNRNKKIIAIIPARGGSKGVPGKNIKLLGEKPLIAWTIDEAKKSRYIDRLIVSSDSEEIIDTALHFGCEAPFLRPAELSGDEVMGVEPFIHAVKTLPEKYDYAVLLQCTSPFRTAEDIDGAIDLCIDQEADSCISVCKAASSPYRMLTVDDKGRLCSFLGSDKTFLPRQKLPEIYEFNGAVYVIKTETLLRTGDLVSENTLAYVMKKERSLDIDSLWDYRIAEALIEKKIKLESGHGTEI